MADREKSGVLARVSRALDIAPDILSRECVVELRGRELISVHGAERILVYLPGEIRVQTPRGILSIAGSGLTFISYGSGSVGIEGRVDKLEFLREVE